MIFLYSLLLIGLGVIHWLIERRAARFERKFDRAAKEADRLLRETQLKGGNGTKLDPYLSAKRQYLLALAVAQRDRFEELHDRWAGRGERLKYWRAKLRDWKGRTLPYTFGVLDVSTVLYLLDKLGPGGSVDLERVATHVSAWLGQ